MKRTFIFILSLFPLLATNLAHAEPKRVQGKILDGTRVSETQYPYVARLSYGGQMLCTGTLIGSRYVLTAAHCFFDARNRRAVGDTEIVARLNGGEYPSVRVNINPAYRARSSACVEGEYDAAIVELASDVSGVTPVPLMESAAVVGSALTIVGYGTEGTGDSGENGNIPPVGQVNVGTTTLQGYGDSPPRTNASSTYHFWRFDRGESNTGSGDSGGPAFIFDGAQPYLTGITCGGEGASQFGTYSFNTRGDILVTWARAITGSAPTNSGPAFPSIPTQQAAIGKSFVFSIPVSGTAPISLSATGLPDGLTLTGSEVSGTPTKSGLFTAVLTAANGFGSTTTSVVFKVSGFNASLKISEVELLFDNDPASDYLAIAGRIAVGSRFKPDRAKVIVTIGRFQKTFRLNRRGESNGNSFSYFDLIGTVRDGRFTRASVPFDLAIDRAALFAELTTLGFPETALAESGQTVSLPVTVSINGVEASTTQILKFDPRDEVWVISR